MIPSPLRLTLPRLFGFLAAIFPGLIQAASPAGSLELEKESKIVIIGNTLAERMQYHGHFEPLLQSRFPEHRLVVRNLGWSADELTLRPRSQNFDDHGHRLEDHQPDVVFAMFGFNESFAGPEGVDPFRRDLREMIQRITTTAYNGESPPQLVLFSPIPHEDLGRRELSGARANNRNLRLYTEALRVEANAAGVRFVDLFRPMGQRMQQSDAPLTINGIHLNDEGNRHLAEVIDAALFGPRPAEVAADLERLREAVGEKDLQFWYDYRAVNGFYIYGGRKNPYGVINFPDEFAKLRKMIANRDQRIWEIAAGRPVSESIDDSNTGELPPIESNVTSEIVATTPEESLKTFTLPDGFVAELVASEVDFPDLQNPVAFQFDARGRIWVSTMPSYPMYLPGTPPDDKILILEDTTGDGKVDKQTVFADRLHLPIGFALGDGGVYVSQQPNLMFLKDTTGDGVADHRELILHGFDSADSHHSISTFVWGPGGDLYFQEGTFHHTQVETPQGPRRLKDAGVFRFEPRTGKFDIFVSYNFANPWGHCFDRWGQNFIADASGGANYYATAFSGQAVYPNKRRRMEQFLEKQWRPTCGCVTVSSRHFPDEMQGNFLLNNTIGFLGTLQYRMREEGSGFAADPVEPLLRATDNNFRPVDLSFGPDGALYLVDWFNPLIGHMQHSLRDPNRDTHHGRIWRIRHQDRPLLTPPKIEGAEIADLVGLLDSYEDSTRQLVRQELRMRETEPVRDALAAWLKESVEDPEAREHRFLEALWVHQHHDWVDQPLLDRVLRSPEPRARAAAVRVLCYWNDRVDDAVDRLVVAAGDEHPRVRLEAVRAASFLEPAAGRRVLAAALEKPLDYYLTYTYNESSDTLALRAGQSDDSDSPVIARLLSAEVEEDQVVSLIALAMPQATAVEIRRILLAVAANPEFSEATQVRAVQALREGASNRRLAPAVAAPELAEHFVAARQAGRFRLAAELAAVVAPWEIEGVAAELRDAVLDPRSPASLVQAALEGIASDKTPGAHDIMGQLTRRTDDPVLRLRVGGALARRDVARSAELVAAALHDKEVPSYDAIAGAMASLLAQQQGTELLAQRLRGGEMSRDTARLALRALYAAGQTEGELSALLSKAAGIDAKTEPLTPAQMQELVYRVRDEGSAERGEWIYRREELNCIKCHAISGAGGNIGPDMSGVGANSSTEYLIESILLPSAQIKEAYLTRNILTVDGQILRGVKVDEDRQRVVLRDADGREISIPVDDIEDESDGPSLMPEGLHHLMTEAELIDLVAYLDALGKPGPYAINTRPTLQRYQRLSDAAWIEKLDAMAEGEMETRLEEVPEEAWTSLYALTDGRLPLGSALPADAPRPVILRGEIDVVEGGAIAVQAQPSANLQIVVGGRSISPTGEQAVEVAVGRHAIYVIQEEGDLAEALTVEVRRPRGSTVQMTVLGGL